MQGCLVQPFNRNVLPLGKWNDMFTTAISKPETKTKPAHFFIYIQACYCQINDDIKRIVRSILV